jgi:hypothetical protein
VAGPHQFTRRDLPATAAPGRPWPAAYRWRRDGLFEQLLAEVHRRADACGELDWLCHDVDGSVIRAHQHAAGACSIPSIEDVKGDHTPPDETLGRRRARCTKAAPAGRGRRAAAGHLATPGQRHKVTHLEACWTPGWSSPAGPMGGQGGSAAQAASQAVGDKGSSFPAPGSCCAVVASGR